MISLFIIANLPNKTMFLKLFIPETTMLEYSVFVGEKPCFSLPNDTWEMQMYVFPVVNISFSTLKYMLYDA